MLQLDEIDEKVDGWINLNFGQHDQTEEMKFYNLHFTEKISKFD